MLSVGVGVADLSDKTVLVTGSTDGLGRETARELARRGATVLVHGRDAGRVNEVNEEIRRDTGNEDVASYVADLSSLDQVRALADDVEREVERLDALVNNAGVAPTTRELSADGYELAFAVNYLSHFLLTVLLLPLLERSAPSRIVNVASIGQAPLDFDDLMLERGFDGFRAYAQSKLAQIAFTFELAERLRERGVEGVTVNALHPATLMDTKMVRETFGRTRSTVEEGVEATVRLVTDPNLEGVSGRYFDGLEESRADEQAYDLSARARLWEASERLTRR